MLKARLSAVGLSALLLLLGACDFVRFPGDGGPPPQTPEPGPAIPPGAPGPPPPEPGEDPWELPPLEEDTTPEPEPADGTAPEEEEPNPEMPVDGTPGEEPSPEETPPGDTPTPDPAEPEAPEPEPEPQPQPEPEPEPQPVVQPVFSFHPPGALLAGSGGGFPEQVVHAPNMVFPIKSAPAYLQSQVFMYGGGVAGGDQCDARNYAYPWRDNFCETRSADRGSPFCPVNKIHQGQDIRVGTAADCNTLRRQSAAARGIHEVVAVEDGVISSIGTYTVKLRSEGSIYNYMHLNMSRLAVTAGQFVKAGDLIGYVSNDFGGTPTTIHLHFEITQNTAGNGWVHVPPYLSLVKAYERRENGPGEQLEPEIGVASAPEWVIPEGYEIIE
ncbi:M23 family metallopeptidase [Hyphomonas sp. NPDC076900]|uniref:M23 family metallopeptidase n=1 Tax=unclassified Hyphomonas TaxID=2630699 RepID=UPI003D06FFD6